MKLPPITWTPLREKYCRAIAEWLIDHEAKKPPVAVMMQCYRQAYNTENLGDASVQADAANMYGSELFQKRLNEILREIADCALISKGMILRETAAIANCNLAHIINDDGTYKKPSEWTEDAKRAVKSIEFDDVGQVKRVILWDKNSSLERLTRIHGMYDDTINVRHSVDELDPNLDPAEAYKKLMIEQSNT